MAELYTIAIPVSTTCIKQGDTIDEWSITFGATDGIDLTGATVRMQIYWNGSKKIDVANGSGITINNALKLTVDKRDYSEDILPEGIGVGDLEITDSSGDRLTMFNVTYTITKHYTI